MKLLAATISRISSLLLLGFLRASIDAIIDAAWQCYYGGDAASPGQYLARRQSVGGRRLSASMPSAQYYRFRSMRDYIRAFALTLGANVNQ